MLHKMGHEKDKWSREGAITDVHVCPVTEKLKYW